VVVIGVALPLLSTVFGLYDTIQHWGKLVHARDGLCATFVFGLLFFGWRDFATIEITDEFAVLTTMFAGNAFGRVVGNRGVRARLGGLLGSREIEHGFDDRLLV
jgi:hypothetical protein